MHMGPRRNCCCSYRLQQGTPPFPAATSDKRMGLTLRQKRHLRGEAAQVEVVLDVVLRHLHH